ncbi:MAG: HK97 family phage prohead protease [Chitinispirillales bacterium]|nr:HK97 family phage prohead protease [Chitinispirillales bacterium]
MSTKNELQTKKEVRAFDSPAIKMLRSGIEGDKQRYVEGCGVVYNREVELWDSYFETIDRGAFDDCLKSNPVVKCFFNHDPNYILSTNRSIPALTLTQRDDGLYFASPIPDTTYGRDLETNLTLKNVTGASFTFIVNEDKVSIDKAGAYHRTITKCTLLEVGPVVNPAYTMTSVGLRDKDSLIKEAEARTKASVEPETAVETSERDSTAEPVRVLAARVLESVKEEEASRQEAVAVLDAELRRRRENENISRRNLLTLLEIEN